MPYTPPAQLSPVASRRESPVISRSNSYTTIQSQPNNVRTSGPSQTVTRPQLPRSSSSTSYLHKHRRSPSMTSPPMTIKDGVLTETPESTPTLPNFPEMRTSGTLSNSVRQSPPPVNDLHVPTGAVISPPDSAQNSSDDEDMSRKGREPESEKLAELQAAIKVIEQNREGSPTRTKAQLDKSKLQLGLKVPNADGAEEVGSHRLSPRPALSPDSRRISHSRSATDSAIIDIDRPAETSDRSADSDVEDETRVQKPPMLRKKSGELVRPALRPASAKRRPSSMPGTPTYSKAVHFDSHLEHVRHFLQVDRPLAVSANTSPVDPYDNESEFPFGETASWRWEIKLPNFPQYQDPAPRPVRVERVFLAADNKHLVGTVAVQNLAFHKSVVARFTLDNWKTTSEVTTEFNHNIRRAATDNLDRFNFNIKLEDLANLENRTLFFCVRYNVNGQEFWDSNNNVNYQVDFSKTRIASKPSTQNTSPSLGALPRSRPSPPISAGKPRPKSASSFDDFARGFDPDFAESSFSLHDTPIKFRNKTEKPTASPRLTAKNPNQAFGNRYDFGASLSAAISSATSTLGERSGLKPALTPANEAPKEKPATTSSSSTSANEADSKPAALTAGKPALQSQSYNELIDKYCFFGSSKTSHVRSPRSGQHMDGADDGEYSSNPSSRSSSGDVSPMPSPPATEPTQAKGTSSPHKSRSPSPATGLERATSPISFGYPYHNRSGGIFSESNAPTAILS